MNDSPKKSKQYLNQLKTKQCWLTWHKCVRSRNLVNELGIPIYEVAIESNPVWRHLGSALWTISKLLKHRPTVIYLQNSFILLLLVALYKVMSFKKIVIIADCHTKSLQRKISGPFKHLFWFLKQFSFNLSNIVVITNENLAVDVKKLSDKPYIHIMPDRPPVLEIDKNTQVVNSDSNYVVYISSFAVDEPFEEIFDVAKIIGNKKKIFWTGRLDKKLIDNIPKPDNLIFTDFLEDKKYYELICNAGCIMAFTTEKYCLQCGAFEAMSLNVPMVLSDTKILKNYFRQSAIYTDHQPENISKAILMAMKNKKLLKERLVELKEVREVDFANQITVLKSKVEEYAG